MKYFYVKTKYGFDGTGFMQTCEPVESPAVVAHYIRLQHPGVEWEWNGDPDGILGAAVLIRVSDGAFCYGVIRAES